MSFQREFEVANPSIYPRDDYVEVDMDTLGVPASLDEKTLKLSRVTKKPGAFPGEAPLSSFEIRLEFCKVSISPIGQSHDQTVALSP